MDIKENIDLSYFSTFKTGGTAKYFSIIKSVEDLKQAVNFATQNSLPVFVLGEGSNLLISDDGVDGMILKMEIKGIDFLEDETNFALQNSSSRAERSDPGSVRVIVGAGEVWDEVVGKCVDKGLCGLENLSHIPGTVGASVVQNIGAYGVEVKDIVDWVEVFNTETKKIEKLTGMACKFGYRDSIFKKIEGKNLIVTRVAYNLTKNAQLKTSYKDIQNYILENNIQSPTLGRLRDIIIDIRKNKLPDCKEVGTAGSFFKNPTISEEKLGELLKKYPELPYFVQESDSCTSYKISLAYILDKILGLKGLKEGNVGLYENQSLVLVNYGGATSEDILNFVKKIKQEVKDKIGIDIYPEVVIW